MNWVVILMVLFAGVATSIQATANSELGKKVGFIEATFISFLVGTISLSIILFFTRKGNLLQALQGPRWHFSRRYVRCVLYFNYGVRSSPSRNYCGHREFLIIGQLTCSAIVDHFGLVGNKWIPIDFQRIIAFYLWRWLCFYFSKDEREYRYRLSSLKVSP